VTKQSLLLWKNRFRRILRLPCRKVPVPCLQASGRRCSKTCRPSPFCCSTWSPSYTDRWCRKKRTRIPAVTPPVTHEYSDCMGAVDMNDGDGTNYSVFFAQVGGTCAFLAEYWSALSMRCSRSQSSLRTNATKNGSAIQTRRSTIQLSK
jgi:hypothetical protein